MEQGQELGEQVRAQARHMQAVAMRSAVCTVLERRMQRAMEMLSCGFFMLA